MSRAASLALFVVALLVVAASGAALDLWGADYAALQTAPYERPSAAHPLGTDALGRDLWARTLQGARLSVFTGLAAALGTVLIGAVVGAAAGLVGGRLDRACTGLADTIASIPAVVALLGLGLALGPGLRSVAVAIAVSQWPGCFRAVRAEAARLRTATFVRAARAMGASPTWIVRRHVLPHLRPLVGTTLAIQLAWSIKAEALLGFFGLSDPHLPSWGRILAESSNEIGRGIWWPLAAAGLPLAIVVFAAQVLADEVDTRPGCADRPSRGD